MQECSKNNNMKGLTKETAEALKFTAQSTAECIQFLLQDLGFYYIWQEPLVRMLLNLCLATFV
jgi:hypothetical protein